jgi:transcriptional regulator with XRE-family HTH domain
MRLGEKLRNLRHLEGVQRGLGRAMTKAEVVRAMRRELGEAVSHPYLCQLEGGRRVHMTARTRELLARFFRVLPGYLVDDPEGFEVGLRTELPSRPEGLQGWFLTQAETLRDEPQLAHVLFKLSRARDPMRFVILLDRLLELPSPELDRIEGELKERSAMP